MQINDLREFSVVRQIKKGGMTELYVALNREHHRVVVRFLRELYDNDKAMRRRFINSLEVLKKLDHPNIVELLKHGMVKQSPYMVIEYYESKNLRELINLRSPLLTGHQLVIMKQLAGAISHIHTRGYLHMDLKPENILIQDNLHCILLDFDLTMKHNADKQMKLKDVHGTPTYFSPEMLREGLVDARSEIYTFGAVIYEMLTLRKPYQSGSPTEFRSEIMDLSTQPIPMSSYRKDIPKAIESIVSKCLAKKPEDRYPSMNLVHRDLMRIA